MSEQSASGLPIVVRHAREDDVDRILDLLTEYDLPRSYFEPFYRDDPSYRPAHSWLVEHNGELAAHVRLFERSVRMHETEVRVAGVGNVITARAFRGQGHAGRLLRVMTSAAVDARFGYSTLWTHLPTLYERYGWVPIEQQTMRAIVSDGPPPGISIRAFRPDDLPRVIALYDIANERRTGPFVRTEDDWRFQLASLGQAPGEFLVACRADGSVAGYIRSRIGHSEVVILDLGIGFQDINLGRALVARAARPRGNHVQMRLPRSLLQILPERERDLEEDSRFMGRVVNLDALVDTLAPVLLRRADAAGLSSCTLSLEASTGSLALQFANRQISLRQARSSEAPASLNEAELAHLLFHGFDSIAEELFDGRPDMALLQALFPTQDFVVWPADAF